MSNYSEKLKDPRWQKKRLEILDRDDFTCQECGDKKTTLNIHHLKYSKNPWDVDNSFLITLCEGCHEIIKNQNQLLLNKITEFLIPDGTENKIINKISDLISWIDMLGLDQGPYNEYEPKDMEPIISILLKVLRNGAWNRGYDFGCRIKK